MGASFLDADQKQQPIIMGCYGLGISRVMMAVAEQKNDDHGIVWPKALAPFDVHLVIVDLKKEAQVHEAAHLYESLQGAGFDVLLDDRPERAGVKFKDADLIGIPIRVVVGKGIVDGLVEVVNRQTGEKIEVEVSKLLEILQNINVELF